jgi:hypothetical protein
MAEQKTITAVEQTGNAPTAPRQRILTSDRLILERFSSEKTATEDAIGRIRDQVISLGYPSKEKRKSLVECLEELSEYTQNWRQHQMTTDMFYEALSIIKLTQEIYARLPARASNGGEESEDCKTHVAYIISKILSDISIAIRAPELVNGAQEQEKK